MDKFLTLLLVISITVIGTIESENAHIFRDIELLSNLVNTISKVELKELSILVCF